MINTAVDVFDRARDRMVGDFRALITDSEDLLKAAATVPGESLAAARTIFEERLKSVKATLADASQPMFDTARETAAADECVHGNPSTAVGVAIAAGASIGYLAAKH